MSRLTLLSMNFFSSGGCALLMIAIRISRFVLSFNLTSAPRKRRNYFQISQQCSTQYANLQFVQTFYPEMQSCFYLGLQLFTFSVATILPHHTLLSRRMKYRFGVMVKIRIYIKAAKQSKKESNGKYHSLHMGYSISQCGNKQMISINI